MKTIESIEQDILALSEDDRNQLLERLSESLVSSEAEALSRESEWDRDPSLGISLDELKKPVGRD